MENMTFLTAAIVTISLALVFYTAGTWGERFQRNIRPWHIICFILGLAMDTTGTAIMTKIDETQGQTNSAHLWTGMIALILMAVHVVWAIWTYFRGSEKARMNFSRYSIGVWLFWLIPYLIGMFVGI